MNLQQPPLVTLEQFKEITTAFQQSGLNAILTITKKHPEGVAALDYDHLAGIVRDFCEFSAATERLIQMPARPKYCKSDTEWRLIAQGKFSAAKEKVKEIQQGKHANERLRIEMQTQCAGLQQQIDEFCERIAAKRRHSV